MHLEKTITLKELVDWQYHWLNCYLTYAKCPTFDEIIEIAETAQERSRKIMHEAGVITRSEFEVDKEIRELESYKRYSELLKELETRVLVMINQQCDDKADLIRQKFRFD